MDSPGPSSQKITTRQATESFRNHWFFGKLKDHLYQSLLPTECDVLKVYFYQKYFLLHLKNSRQLADDDKDLIFETLSREIVEIWEKSSIPTLDKSYVKKNIKKLAQNGENFAHNNSKRRKNDSVWIEANKKNFDSLFDCSKCPCFKRITKCEELDDTSCKCPESEKIADLQFYVDQKSSRKMKIGSTFILKPIHEMQNLVEQYEDIEDIDEIDDIEFSDEFDSPSDKDFEFQPSSRYKSKGIRNTFEFPETIETSKRYDISVSATAALINSHTNDLAKIIGFDPKQYYASTTKISNMRDKYGDQIIQDHASKINSIECLGFDGKKSQARKKNSGTEVLDKITVVGQPGSFYVDHFVPKSGTALNIASDMVHIMEKFNSKESMVALQADGCRTNTGENGGAIRFIEVEV